MQNGQREAVDAYSFNQALAVDAERRRDAIRARNPQWVERTLAQHLARQATDFPDRPFLVTDAQQLSYAQTLQRVRAFARGLMAIGIGRGDHVALLMANYPELIVLRFALAAIGAVGVPVNTLLKATEIGYVLKQSDTRLLITMERFRELDYLAALDQVMPGWEKDPGPAFPRLQKVITFAPDHAPTRAGTADLGTLLAAGEAVSEDALDRRMSEVSPHDLLDIVYTSGTTGLPKGVMLTHDTVLRCSFTASLARAMQDGRRLLFSLPLYHSYAYIEGLMAATWVAGAIVMQNRFDAEATLAAIDRHQVNEVLLVPTMTIAMLEHPNRTKYSLRSLTAVMSAAAPAPVTLWEDICRAFGVQEVTTAYGQTELSSSAAYKRPEDPLVTLTNCVGRLKPRSVAGSPEIDGRVAAYRVADPVTGEELPPGQDGELIAWGPEMMKGYYNKPEETAAVFRADGWMRTGDLGHIRADGYIVLTGRSKELYKCGGELVAPKEVEDLLTSRDDVSQAYVVGVPDVRMGEVGYAFVVPAPGHTIDRQALRGFCRERLARYKVPEEVVVIEAAQLPTTATGKVQKFALREQARELLKAQAVSAVALG